MTVAEDVAVGMAVTRSIESEGKGCLVGLSGAVPQDLVRVLPVLLLE